MGGCDKQGFPMKQGVLTPGRVRLLLHRGEIPLCAIGLGSLIYKGNISLLCQYQLIILIHLARNPLLPWLRKEERREEEEVCPWVHCQS